MSDTENIEPGSAAAYALNRLRKLADGNGLNPDAIRLYAAEEKTYEIEGVMTLSPLFETRSQRHIGPPAGGGRIGMSSVLNMRAEVERRRQEFQTKAAWVPDAIAQLKEQPGEGWGLDDVRIPLPKQSAILAASENCAACQGARRLTCPQCLGQGSIVCPQCRGNRQEICPICNGTGNNPLQHDQRCSNCNGQRYVPCRYCHGSGQLACPTCHGQRGVNCTSCNGTGLTTEEIAIDCGARTQFRVKGSDLPSGLRRGLDRLGFAKLVDGHADIESITVAEEEEDKQPAPQIAGASTEAKKEKAPKPEVHYRARMPYADLRMNVGGKKGIVGVFGKKKVILGVPAFLDTALEPARAKLRLVATGAVGGFDDVMKLRAMRDTLKLQLSGQSKPEALRRIYPLGLTQNVAAEILTGMRQALNRMTLRLRALAAAGCGLVGVGLLAVLLLAPWRDSVMQGWRWTMRLGFDVATLPVVMLICWFGLSTATRIALRKRFPGFTVPVLQKTGKTGGLMLAVVIVVWAMMALGLPDGPQWWAALAALRH